MSTWVTDQGRIQEIQEGDFFDQEIEFTGNNTTANLISGDLPPGLTWTQNSNTTVRIFGQTEFIKDSTNYDFTFRITHNDSNNIVDRWFQIRVTNIQATWTQQQNLGTYSELDTADILLSANDPGGDVEYTMKSGNLPPGLVLSGNRISGKIEQISADTTFTFTITANTSSGDIDRTFTLHVIQISANQPPTWVTPAGDLGDISFLQSKQFQVKAVDAQGDDLTYTLVSGQLPPNLSMNSDGLITGQCVTQVSKTWTFGVQVDDGLFGKTRTFSIRTNDLEEAKITWLQDSDLGDLKVGENSLLTIQTESNYVTRYELVSGVLPNGLSIQEQTGHIYGTTGYQTLGEYSFRVRAYNAFVSTEKQFIIRVTENYDQQTMRAFIDVPMECFHGWIDYITNDYLRPYEILYRPVDERLGSYTFPRIMLADNVLGTKSEIQNELDGLQPLEILVGELKLAFAYDDQGNKLYEVLYREILDFGHTVTDYDHPVLDRKVRPNSIEILRNKFDNIGRSGIEQTPTWMDDFTPSLIVAYINPGFGVNLLTKLKNNEEIGVCALYGRKWQFDKITFESVFSDNSRDKFNVKFYSHKQSLEDQRMYALNAPEWTIAPESLGEFNEGDTVNIDLNTGTVVELTDGELPNGLSIVGDKIQGTMIADESKSWKFTLSAVDNGYKRPRGFSIQTNL